MVLNKYPEDKQLVGLSQRHYPVRRGISMLVHHRIWVNVLPHAMLVSLVDNGCALGCALGTIITTNQNETILGKDLRLTEIIRYF